LVSGGCGVPVCSLEIPPILPICLPATSVLLELLTPATSVLQNDG